MMTLFISSYKAIPQAGVSAGSGFCVVVSLDQTAFSLERRVRVGGTIDIILLLMLIQHNIPPKQLERQMISQVV